MQKPVRLIVTYTSERNNMLAFVCIAMTIKITCMCLVRDILVYGVGKRLLYSVFY